MSNLFNQNIAPQRQLEHVEETARRRQQRNLERAELKRKVHGDGPDHERRSRLLVLVASLVGIALVVLVVLVLTGKITL